MGCIGTSNCLQEMSIVQGRQSRFGYRFCKIKREATPPHESQPFVASHFILPNRTKKYLRSNISDKMKTYTNQKFISVFVCVLFHVATYAQVNFPPTPQPSTFTPINTNPSNNNYNRQTPPTNSSNGINVYEEDLKRQRQQREQLNEILNETDRDYNRTIYYDLPSCANKKGAEFYRQSFLQLQKIIQSDTLSLKESIFTVENAFFENKMSYETFNKYLKECIEICNWKFKKDGYKETNQLAKVFVLYQFFSDTINYKYTKTKQWKTHYPFKYDFDDYEGREDYSKMFVSKLMATNSGQCHSLPLLFLILAQEWNVDAYLSFSPNHSFVRFKDAKGKIRNIELTNGQLTSDNWVTGSGYVKAEALKSKIYLDTISKKKIIAQCFADLAQGYTAKYCYDKFVLQCTNEAIKYFPTDIFAQQVKSDYYTLQFDYVIKQLGKPPLKDLPKYPQAYDIYKKRNQIYDLVDNLGFEPMPSDAYQKWLKSVQEEKNKQESEQLKINIQQSIRKD